MKTNLSTEGKILLSGLAARIASQLAEVLTRCSQRVVRKDDATPSDLPGMLPDLDPDVVFCPAEPSYYRRVLESMRRTGRSIPLIVVSQNPETQEWLDAMEEGASDYCSVPFETGQIQWIIENTLHSRNAQPRELAGSASA